jgi:[ribosomal protein S18]-alanine N-acetyltransferase
MIEEKIQIKATTDAKIFEKCAMIMSLSDPWISLEMDFEQCIKAFEGDWREVYILEYDGDLAGFVIIQPYGTFKGYIQTICISEKYRGKGFGKTLLQFCEDKILAFSPNIFICVSSFNTRAIKLYEEFGFKHIGALENFVKDGFTELLLHKTFGSILGFSTQNAKFDKQNL